MIFIITPIDTRALEIKRLDLASGKMLRERLVFGDLTIQTKHLIWSMRKDGCTNIIFDLPNKDRHYNLEQAEELEKIYMSRLQWEMKRQDSYISFDENGVVSYRREYNTFNEIL